MFLASISTAIIKTKTTRHAYHRNNRASLRSCTSRSLPAQSKLLHPTHHRGLGFFFWAFLPGYFTSSSRSDDHFLQIIAAKLSPPPQPTRRKSTPFSMVLKPGQGHVLAVETDEATPVKCRLGVLSCKNLQQPLCQVASFFC